MKKYIKALVLIFVLMLCTLVFASCDAKTVTRVYVNDEMHAIAEYSDGTTEDLGYVGVEVEKEVEKQVEVIPPKYTVTFLDAFGATLKTQKVYKGDAAEAPEAPEISEKAFDRWDSDITNITADLTVRPIYVAAAEYTVTFLDETGALIEKVTVMHGKGATAPTAPKRADTIFKEWDTAFDCVKSDLTIRAVYRAKNTYTVTFKDYSGVVLAIKTVKETGNATAPPNPTRAGHDFAGWSSSFTNITSNKTITAKYNLASGNNLIDYDYAIKSDGTVEMTVSLKRPQSVGAFEAVITLPAGVSVVNYEGLSNALVKQQSATTYKISYINQTGATATTELLKLTLRPEAGVTSLTFAMSNIIMTDASIPTPVALVPNIIGDTLKLN